MNVSDFQLLEKGAKPCIPKHPGLPYVGLNCTSLYISAVAAKLIDAREGESLKYARNKNRMFLYRTSEDGYVMSRSNARECYAIAANKLRSAGFEEGEYMLADPIHAMGLDLFEIITIEEYKLRNE